MLLIRIRLSTPETFMISNATAVEALPDIGLINIRGSKLEGIFNKLSRGDRIFSNRSKMPEVLSAEIAKNNPTRVGNICITVFIPSFAPNYKTVKNFNFFRKSICNYIKNSKRNCNYGNVVNNTQSIPPVNYLPSLINILAVTIATNAAENVAIHTGKIILVGFVEFKEALIDITVVGISCKDAVFNKTSIAIELLKVFFFEFSFCRESIALRPRGVEAFPRPKIFAIIFNEISSCAGSFSDTSGNRKLIKGFKHLASLLDKEESLAICIIPHQSVIVPKKVIVSSTADDADSNMPIIYIF